MVAILEARRKNTASHRSSIVVLDSSVLVLVLLLVARLESVVPVSAVLIMLFVQGSGGLVVKSKAHQVHCLGCVCFFDLVAKACLGVS